MSRDVLRHQIDVTNHARVVQLSMTLALRNLLPQIRQPHIGTVAFNQSLLSVLARAPAFLAGQANDVAGIFEQLKRAVPGLRPHLETAGAFPI